MTDTLDERWLHETFADIAGAAVVDESLGRPAAWRALKRRTRRRAQRRGALAFAVVAIGVVGVAARLGDDANHTLKTVGASSTSTVPHRSIPRRLTAVGAFPGRWAPEPIAYDGHDVWLAHENGDGHAPTHVVVERRDATSGALLTSINVPQEDIFSIAYDSGSVWVSGGGDGAVPQTTVSRIDVRTRRVVSTHTLSNACSCSIAAGAGGLWIGGQGSPTLMRIDEQTGAVSSLIPLPAASFSLAVVGDRVQVGLGDSRVAVVDPATNHVERVISLQAPSHPAFGVVTSIAPEPSGVGGSDSWATRGDGVSFEIAANQRLSGRVAVVPLQVGVGSATTTGRLFWAVGANQVFVNDLTGRGETGYANFDVDHSSFGPILPSPRRFVPTTGSDNTLDRIVATGPTLWIAEFNGPVVVVRPS